MLTNAGHTATANFKGAHMEPVESFWGKIDLFVFITLASVIGAIVYSGFRLVQGFVQGFVQGASGQTGKK